MGDADLNQVFALAAEWRERLLSEMERSAGLVELVEKATLTDEGIRLGLNIPVPCAGPGGATLRKVLNLFRFVPLKVKRRGVEMRLIINGDDEPRKARSCAPEGLRTGERMVRRINLRSRPFARRDRAPRRTRQTLRHAPD